MELARRVEGYRLIHKALRLCMMESLCALGAVDCDDDVAVAQALKRTREMLAFCRAHGEHEDAHIHAAVAKRCPGAFALLDDDHRAQRETLRALDQAIDAAANVEGADRASAMQALYASVATFLAENLLHLAREERHANATLWRLFTDDELAAIHRGLVDSLSPEDRAASIHWMMRAISPRERAEVLGRMRHALPVPVYLRAIESALDLLGADEAQRVRDLLEET